MGEILPKSKSKINIKKWSEFGRLLSLALKMIALKQQLKDPQLVKDGNNDGISITLMEF